MKIDSSKPDTIMRGIIISLITIAILSPFVMIAFVFIIVNSGSREWSPQSVEEQKVYVSMNTNLRYPDLEQYALENPKYDCFLVGMFDMAGSYSISGEVNQNIVDSHFFEISVSAGKPDVFLEYEKYEITDNYLNTIDCARVIKNEEHINNKFMPDKPVYRLFIEFYLGEIRYTVSGYCNIDFNVDVSFSKDEKLNTYYDELFRIVDLILMD